MAYKEGRGRNTHSGGYHELVSFHTLIDDDETKKKLLRLASRPAASSYRDSPWASVSCCFQGEPSTRSRWLFCHESSTRVYASTIGEKKKGGQEAVRLQMDEQMFRFTPRAIAIGCVWRVLCLSLSRPIVNIM